MKKFITYFLKYKSVTWLILIFTLVGGLYAYVNMGKLEDAPFTIKQALVTTSYPGASPSEVQSQVTDILEESIQSLGELYYLKTENRAGLSKITVYVKKEIRADEMQQLWDKLRRKVSDVQDKLPAGAGRSVVNDDFGDVLGVFYGLCGEDYSNRELEEKATRLKNELLKIKDVAKVELFGIQPPSIDISLTPATLTRTGITPERIAAAFDKQNKIVDAGALETEFNRLRIDTRGSFTSLEEIENLMIMSEDGEYFRLKDIAEISESYITPARNMMTVGNVPAIGIAVSTVPDGNVVEMAEAVKKCISDFGNELPAGMFLTNIYDQGEESAAANDGFILNLILSVVTVIAILLFFIGFENGILVSSGLVFSIFATLVIMWSQGIALQRMSLAAIIIAMGMLVDNAIVVFDSSMVNMQRGLNKRNASLNAVSSTALPLLAATVIAVLAFLPVYLSPHITGEILSSLFIVIAVSLLSSWGFAIIQTPFFIQEFVRRKKTLSAGNELFQGRMYDFFRKCLHKVVLHKWAVTISMACILLVSLAGFRSIPKVFMPQLNKKYFTMDMWLPEGTKIEKTGEETARMVDFIKGFPQVAKVSSFIGQTPPRYYLGNAAYGPQPNYAQCIVETISPEDSRELQKTIRDSAATAFPDMLVRVNKFELGSIPQALIEARFCGDDPEVLDSLVNIALDVMHRNPKAANVRNEWGNMAMTVSAGYDPVKSGISGISKSAMMKSAKSIHDGVSVGIFRDRDKEVPVMLKTAGQSFNSITDLKDVPVWDGRNSAPLAQIAGDIAPAWEWPLVKTYNRQLSMAASCDVKDGYTMSEVRNEIADEIESIELPDGYSFFWDSQYKDQKEGIEALFKYFPLAFLIIVVILVALFGNFKEPLIILIILPFSAIGVIAGLLMTGFDFGFFAIAGWLGLLGMMIKNVIVLLDEFNVQIKNGRSKYDAIVEATISRMKPVLMAATTTIFGMIPLLFDVVFQSMAATIVFGLTFATILTLFITPALCSIFYEIKK